MRIFKNKAFHRWAVELKMSDSALVKAVQEIEQGLYEANLGGTIYKKRVAINNRGKSGGVRTLIAFKLRDKAFFIYGFAKNTRDNITTKEEVALKALAKVYFNYDEKQLHNAVKIGELIEVSYEKIYS